MYMRYNIKSNIRIFVKMIRKINQHNTTLRQISTSQETNKPKKSTSSSAKNKINISSMCSSMTSAIKKNRVEGTKSNKKTPLITSSSNKSLKNLRENAHNFKVQTTKKKDKENKEEEKKGTIMVKNIKNKIVGNNPLSSKTITNNSKKIQNKTQYKVIENKTINTPRNNLNKSINLAMNSRESVILPPTQTLTMEMFEVGRKLGKGRFGDVYMARQLKTGFALAIKVISKKQLKQSEMEAQLIQEIKVQMYSSHPNILKMYGFFADENKIYLLLQLATNGCLFKEIRQKAYFQEDLACYYFRQVSSGIRYLHSHSIIHRDIKPQNILNCFNVLKICDFGWAIYSPIYQRQTFCGTLDYVPPQIVTGDFYDEKADVWCLGVLCYELCTGKAPFESKTDENETYDKILKVDIQFPLYMSPQVVDFIGKILNRDPQKRINLEEIETHEWMRTYENESGRMISKEIWDSWMKLTK